MRHVILGASAAGINAAKTLRLLNKDAEIVVVSVDEYVYSRCMLHHLISGERDIQGLSFVSENFFDEFNINWIKGVSCVSLDVAVKSVELSDGRFLEYDRLLIATGASSFIPNVPNLRTAKNVFGLRNLDDAQLIAAKAQNARNVVVMGAGLVGLDAVIGLIHKNVTVHLVEMFDRVLPMQLDAYAASVYEQKLREKGVNLYTSVRVEEVTTAASGNIEYVKLSNGVSIRCDVAVVATGVVPNIDFVNENEIKVNRGILINGKSETSAKDVYAAGDVTGATPIWPLASKQGVVAAYNMSGIEKYNDDLFALRNSMNFMDIPTVSLGMIHPDADCEVKVYRDTSSYKKFILKNSILHGVILQGDIAYSGIYRHLIRHSIDISRINKEIDEVDYADFYEIKPDGQYVHSVV